MRAVRVYALVAVLAGSGSAVSAQTYAELLAKGDSLHAALQPAEALEAYRGAFFAAQTTSYEVLWKFARSQIDVAKQLVGKDHKKTRDSLYAVARQYAELAILADSLDPDGHFMLANALGRLSRTRGGRERVRFAREIYDLASKAIELDPDHDGAFHVLGAWHAEIMRLSGLTKFFAKTFFGAAFMNRASRDSAALHLERAVELRPGHIYHRLELSEVYIELERYADARRQLEAITALPPTSDVMDPVYQDEAVWLLDEIRAKTDG